MDGDGGSGGDGADAGGHSANWGSSHGNGGMTDTHSAMGQTHTAMSSTQGFGLSGGHCAVSGVTGVHGVVSDKSDSEAQCTLGDNHEGRSDLDLSVQTRSDLEMMSFIRSQVDQLGLANVDMRASYLHPATLFYAGRVVVAGTFGAPAMVPADGCADDGTTEVWRNYWQLGHRRGPVGFMESFGFSEIPVIPRNHIRGFIEVTRVRWASPDGKFEEHLRVVVKHVQVKVLSTGTLVCDIEDEARHWKTAKQLFEKCGNYLKSHSCT